MPTTSSRPKPRTIGTGESSEHEEARAAVAGRGGDDRRAPPPRGGLARADSRAAPALSVDRDWSWIA